MLPEGVLHIHISKVYQPAMQGYLLCCILAWRTDECSCDPGQRVLSLRVKEPELSLLQT